MIQDRNMSINDKTHRECTDCGTKVTGALSIPCPNCGGVMDLHRPENNQSDAA